MTSGVFLLEQSTDIADLEAVLDELEEVIDDPDLARDIASLLSDLAIKLDLSKEEIPRVETFEEVKMSLLQRADKWTQQWMAEGEAKGEANVVQLLIEEKFGALSDVLKDRIRNADSERLLEWARRILTAQRLEEVFGDTN